MTTEQTVAAIEAVAAAINRLADAVASTKVTEAVPQAPQPRKRREGAVTVSEALAEFAGLVAAEETTRSAASKAVMEYVRANKLQDPQDKRQIVPDAALGALLGSPDRVNVLNLASSLRSHFSPVK